MLWYYYTAFIISLILSVLYIARWQKHFDVNITISYFLMPLSILAFCMMYHSGDDTTMRIGTKLIYIGGCFLPWFIDMAIAGLCKVQVPRSIRVSTFLLNLFFYSMVLTVGYFPWFYKYFTMVDMGHYYMAVKEYGFMHSIFYVLVMAYQFAGFGIILYSFFLKNQISRKILGLLVLPQVVTVVAYLFNRYMPAGLDAIPLTYIFAQIIYLFIADQMALYDVSEMVVESLVQSGETGFITLTDKFRYLGSNETAKNIIPKLRNLRADQSIRGIGELEKDIIPELEKYTKDGKNKKIEHNRLMLEKKGENETEYYTVTLDYLQDGLRRRGFQIFFENDTKNQQYIRLQEKYTDELETEVEAKTQKILQMHDNLILSMASMVESRDNSTGGHIKRTSVGVRILIGEMKKDNKFNLSEEFCNDIIKAAPMHDLGKIAVKDSILQKKGSFNPGEFDQMKEHAAEGARIVHEILKDTEDESFKIIAENVAHYHHERIDGSGYPMGLKGDEIPLEARIMAIADVYDALVSKRCYKERMSFEEADSIIMNGMGTQFDKRLEDIYVAARPKLEEFYTYCRNNGEA